MRKQYEPPMLEIEEYELSDSIAANCATQAFTPETSCGADFGYVWQNPSFAQLPQMFVHNIIENTATDGTEGCDCYHSTWFGTSFSS